MPRAGRRTTLPSTRARFFTLAVACVIAALATERAAAQITRIEVESISSPALDGQVFGDIGPYERIRAIFHGELDPGDRRNAGIVLLDLAPRNERGRVEYATTVEIFRPAVMAGWNGAIYHTVPNRGGAGAGDRALLERGFALVRVGWQGDLTPTATNVTARLPVARHPDGSSVTGTAYEEFIFNDASPSSTATLTWPAASLDPSRATLTVRRNRSDAPASPEDLTWSFDGDHRLVIERPEGYDGGAIYELVYEARDPAVMGIGFAAVRDAIAFLRHEAEDLEGNPNPLAPPGPDGSPRTAEFALSLGISQSGRFLRDFLYQGFNEDLQGRRVFDGLHPDIAGARRTFTNHPFSQPGRWQRQHEDRLFPGDQFPFTWSTLTDPLTGRTDGLLERCRVTATCPLIVQTDGEAELWQARASLLVTDPLGEPIELPDNVRVYLVAGTQHGGAAGVHVATPSAGMCRFPSNPMALSQIRTSVTIALWEWVSEGIAPPESRFPTVLNGGLIPPDEATFPALAGEVFTGSYNPLHRLDHSTVPPTVGSEYTVLLPRTDADGNMTHGVHHPFLQAPIGTHTGWNLRAEGFAPGEQCGGTGAYSPFARTREEREASGDPRLSLRERYPEPADYVAAVARAATELVQDRLLLPEHAAEILRLAREHAP